MKWLKVLLIILALGLGAYLLFWLFGVLYSLLWYVVIFGVIALGGAVGYKLLSSGGDEEKPRLEEKKPTAVSEFEDVDRALEEMKKKYLNEEN